MRKTKEQKAITLIALIITIVVLLILAVVAINAVTGDGIIQHATNARSEYDKAQDVEEDMLEYYEGVLQSGEVVPTVEQLDEKYEFEYFSSLSRAIENVNGTEDREEDANVDNAVAGVYSDEDGNKYVVLMKDTEESSALSVAVNMTLNLGGKTLSFTADEAYLSFALETINTVDGRIDGSTIQKNIEEGTGYGIINSSNGNSLTINSGKYSMVGKYTTNNNVVAVIKTTSKNVNVNNAQIILKNDAESTYISRGLTLDVTEEAIINNCKINITGKSGYSYGIRCSETGKYEINNTSIYVTSDTAGTCGLMNFGETVINNMDIFADAISTDGSTSALGIKNYNKLNFYSGSISATTSAIEIKEDSETFIYGGTFCGYLWGALIIRSSNGKIYIENSTIGNGEYAGKYEISNIPEDEYVIWVGGKHGQAQDNIVYIDNCNIVGVNGAISLPSSNSSTGNEVYISNSKITGTANVDSENAITLGAGMNIKASDVTGDGSVSKSTTSYKGMDKILMTEN